MSELCFCSSAFGSWGIVRLGSLVPECHLLFACPYSCGRHNSIGAIKHGYKDKISYLFIDENDLALGTIHQDLLDSTEYIIKTISPTPKVILIYFSCVLYMSGFDWDALIENLSNLYPNIQFRACMMNPIAADRSAPPVPSMIKTLCSLWDKDSGKKMRTANLLGCYSNISKNSELYEVLHNCGLDGIRHFTDFSTYDEYKKMGHSECNIVVRPEGLLAAKWMKNYIPFCFVPVSYNLDEVKKQYNIIFDLLGKSVDISKYEIGAKAAISRALLLIKDMPIAISSSATNRPFDLAMALINYGFTVSDIFYDSIPEYESFAADFLSKQQSISLHKISSPKYSEEIGKVGNAKLSIGYIAGYYSGSPYVADLMIDEGMFGYHGICKLMDLMIAAIEHPSPVEDMIENYGLII